MPAAPRARFLGLAAAPRVDVWFVRVSSAVRSMRTRVVGPHVRAPVCRPRELRKHCALGEAPELLAGPRARVPSRGGPIHERVTRTPT